MTRYELADDSYHGSGRRRPMRRGRGAGERYGSRARRWSRRGELTSDPPVYRRHGLGYATEHRTVPYGREFRKSRWETDHGDPFRDRERRTPIRLMPGGWRETRDALYGGWLGRRRGRRLRRGYDREYRARRLRWQY